MVNIVAKVRILQTFASMVYVLTRVPVPHLLIIFNKVSPLFECYRNKC